MAKNEVNYGGLALKITIAICITILGAFLIVGVFYGKPGLETLGSTLAGILIFALMILGMSYNN